MSSRFEGCITLSLRGGLFMTIMDYYWKTLPIEGCRCPYSRIDERNCPKSPARPYNIALRDTGMVLFGPFWRAYTAKSTVETPLLPLFGQSRKSTVMGS